MSNTPTRPPARGRASRWESSRRRTRSGLEGPDRLHGREQRLRPRRRPPPLALALTAHRDANDSGADRRRVTGGPRAAHFWRDAC